MTRITLTLAAALIAGTAFIASTPADAAGCGGYASGASKSYSSSSRSAYQSTRKAKAAQRRKAAAKAKAKARRKARLAAAAKAKAKADTKADSKTASNTSTTKTDGKTIKVAALANKVALGNTGTARKVINDSIATTDSEKICRKFSAAVGGLIEIPCN